MKPKPFQKQCVIHIALLRFGEGFGDFTSAVAQEHILQGITRALQVDAITKEVAQTKCELGVRRISWKTNILTSVSISTNHF